jgi:alpha-glucosidase
MDIKIDQMDDGRQYLEYNTLGGVFDFYFMAGPTPKDVSKQYAGVVGLPAMQSYWSFGVCNSAKSIMFPCFPFYTDSTI